MTNAATSCAETPPCRRAEKVPMVFFGQPLRLCQGAAPREGDRVMRYFAWISVAAFASLALPSGAALADDTLRLAVGAPNNWDSGVSDVGVRAGIFKKHGLALE